MEKTYFDRPAQVVFADPDNPGEWLVGIAYQDEVICACCGGVFRIDEVIEMTHENGVNCAIYVYPEWVDITNEIVGDELPEALDRNEDGEIYEVSNEDYEQHSFLLEEEEEAAVFAKTCIDGVVIPSIDE
jgi:hypothetical protein